LQIVAQIRPALLLFREDCRVGRTHRLRDWRGGLKTMRKFGRRLDAIWYQDVLPRRAVAPPACAVQVDDVEAYAGPSFPESGNRAPSDRMLVTQAQVPDFTILTMDQAFASFAVRHFLSLR